MYRSLILIVIFLLIATVVYAQEDGTWQANNEGNVEYNCETLPTVLTAIAEGDPSSLGDFADAAIARYEDGEVVSVYDYIGSTIITLFMQDADASLTVDDIFGEAIAVCDGEAEPSTVTAVDSFNVLVTGNVNLRSCASTDCDVVGQVENGELLTVIGEDGDWYQVQTEDGTAFIANWLTTRGPDDVVQVDETYVDARTGCIVAFDIKRGDMDMNLILAGDSRNDVIVDLYRPNETNPLRVEGQLDKTFIDTGEPYIHSTISLAFSGR